MKKLCHAPMVHASAAPENHRHQWRAAAASFKRPTLKAPINRMTMES
jgi:hypothetical protein